MPRAAPRAASRRPAAVTRAFLFCDLRGYTGFVESHGDAAAAELLRDYRTIVRREVAEHDGAEIKTEGDSFYVVFGAASAALACAVDLLRAAEAHTAAEPARSIQVGVGLHAGESVEYDDQFVGSAVNIAARLASKARAGELLVSDTLRGLVRTSQTFVMTDRGPLRLKGVTERIRAWEVEWQERAAAPPEPAPAAVEEPLSFGPLPSPVSMARPGVGQIVCPVVVGRESEAARASEMLAAAGEGRGQTLVVAGEAGVGKTAYVREVMRAAAERGFRALAGATLESDAGLPYAPFISAVRSGFRGLGHDRLGRVLTQAAPDLAQLFPELGRAPSSRPRESEGLERHRLALAFQGLFLTFARESPVVLLLEDLHWADETSLALLHHLARELRDARVLLLATYRSDEMHRRHPLLRVLATLQRERIAHEVQLRRLDRERVRDLIRATFAVRDPGVSVSDAFLDAVYERAEGNPFFTEELLRTLVDSGDVFFREGTGWERKDISELRIPESVREAVRARLERLSPHAQATLSAAAVIGQRFSFEILGSVRAVAQPDLLAHLREFVEQQLVGEGGEGDAYAFRHALTREVVYDDLLVPERKELHRAVAAELRERPGVEPSLLAHHLLAAGDPHAAVPHLLEAARRAYGADAPHEATAHYERALEISVPPNEHAPTLEGLAEAYNLVDWTRARRAAEQAARAYRDAGDARGASRMLRLASRSYWQMNDSERATALAREAIEAVSGMADSPELARATANLAGMRMTDGDHPEAIGLAERAIDLAERFDDAWALSNALITKGTALIWTDAQASRGLIERGMELARSRGIAEVALRGYNNLSLTYDELGLGAERTRALRDGIEYARAHHVQHPMLSSGLAFELLGEGDWPGALAATAETTESSGVWFLNSQWVRGFIGLARSGPAAREDFMRAAEARIANPDAQWQVSGLLIAAELELVADDVARAKARVEQLRARLEKDAGARAQLSHDYPLVMACVLGAECQEPVLVDLAEGRIGRARSATAPVVAILAARCLLRGDVDAAGEHVAGLWIWTLGRGMPALALATYRTVRFAQAAARLGLRPTETWSPTYSAARDVATKLEARWWVAELDRIWPDRPQPS